ncbi:MAG: cation transporter [Lachnospiraceae bacterium]|nr:cation transporter [Lachnospiraceae bacterium]
MKIKETFLPSQGRRDQSADDYQRKVRQISVLGMAVNLLLAAFKFIAGFVGKSDAMISDAVHSSSDIVGGLIVVIGVSFSEKQADDDHPYGHERLESVASLLLALLLFAAGLAVAYSSADKVLGGGYLTMETPGLIALIAAIVSILSKEALFWYTMSAAKRLNSGALKAEAWHHRSDALSSIGSLIGIAGARLGFPIMDPIAGLLISFFILKSAWDICKDAMEKMVDHRGDAQTEADIAAVVKKHPGVEIDLLTTREFGRKLYADLEIRMDGNLTLSEAHRVAEAIHDELEHRFPQLKHVMIHINPDEG